MAIRQNLTTDTPASLGELFAQIEEYQHLGPNWDGEDALPIMRKVVLRAKNLLQRIAAEASLVGLRWVSPSVAPNPAGALELSWEKDDRWVMLIIEPGHSKVACAMQENGAEPRYRSVSGDDAVEQVLWAIRG
jgi:hypothetical protein